jgi:hypothetical protein
VWGIGAGQLQRKSDGTWEDWRDRQAKFAADREELLSGHAVEPFLLSLAFLSKVKSTKTIRQGTGSYWLKHIAENYHCTYPEGDSLGPQYVANGVLIAAAVHAGFRIKTYVDHLGYDLPNVSFNMSTPLLLDLDCEIRPDCAAQYQRRRQERRRH